MNRKVLVGAAIVGAVALLLWANLRKIDESPTTTASAAKSRGQTQGPAGAPLVKVVTMRKQPLTQEVLAPGAVEASGLREVRAPFSAKEITLLVGMGDRVEEGQVLARLASEELAAQVAAQEAQVARAEASLAGLRLQQQQAPIQLAQRLEQARVQLLQAEDGLGAVNRQAETLRTRMEQARANLTLLQNRSNAGSAQVEAARKALEQAETAYLASPLQPGLRESYEQARSAYESALEQSQEAARQTAAELKRAYDELEAAEKEYARASGENPEAVALARSQVEAARLAVQMAEMEAESGGTIAGQARAAQADLAAARAALDALRAKLSQAEVKAQAGGTVLTVAIRDGQPVQEGQPLLTLGSLTTLTVNARVDEIDIGKVKPGQPLSVRSNAYPQNRFEGQVVRVAAQTTQSGSSASQYFEVEGEVANTDDLLRSGMQAEVTITAAKRDAVMVVGLASVREEENQASVLVVENFQVKVRPVKIGLRTQTQVEILEGLVEGDQVIVSPFTLVNSLKEGDAVRTEPFEESAP
ncbi:MAG: efflux RND transporter periplasmic adaptor subunit [Bacillota bacterium]